MNGNTDPAGIELVDTRPLDLTPLMEAALSRERGYSAGAHGMRTLSPAAR